MAEKVAQKSIFSSFGIKDIFTWNIKHMYKIKLLSDRELLQSYIKCCLSVMKLSTNWQRKRKKMFFPSWFMQKSIIYYERQLLRATTHYKMSVLLCQQTIMWKRVPQKGSPFEYHGILSNSWQVKSLRTTYYIVLEMIMDYEKQLQQPIWNVSPIMW